MYCACTKSFLFIFDRLYVCGMRMGKGVIFVSFASFFMWCEQFGPGGTFYFDDFSFIG